MTLPFGIFWPGSCVVHEEFKSVALQRMKKLHPDAAVLVHPESTSSVIEEADVVGSTTALINAVVNMPHHKFIVATDAGIFNKMRQLAPEKELIEAPTAGEGATCQSWEPQGGTQACTDKARQEGDRPGSGG